MEQRKRVGAKAQHQIGEQAGAGGESGLPHGHRDHLGTFLSTPSYPTSPWSRWGGEGAERKVRLE